MFSIHAPLMYPYSNLYALHLRDRLAVDRSHCNNHVCCSHLIGPLVI